MSRRLPRDARRRLLVVAGAAVAALVLAGLVLDRLAPEPTGPRSSSYATAPAGAAAWAELLERRGRRVLRVREDVRDATLPRGTTVVLLDPGPLGSQERRALGRLVRAGARLVAAGEGSAGVAAAVLDRPPRRAASGPRSAAPLAPVPEAVGRVETAGEGRWLDAGQALPALGGDGGALLVVAPAGRGEVALLADASPVQNRLLGRAENAALALALAPRGRPVAFVESVHGYGVATGLDALPGRWKVLLAGLGLAGLVLMLAHARRLGPPERPEGEDAPPRRLYVDAVGRTLARAGDPLGAAGPVRQAARDLVLARTGLPGGAGDAEVEQAARRLGLDEDEARAVAGRATHADVVTIGRAHARLRGGGA